MIRSYCLTSFVLAGLPLDWRPTTAIREATPGERNDLTDGDASWTSRGGVGGSTEYWPGQSSFSGAAGVAGISGIFGGLHFPFSHTDGLAAGRAIAREILANKLLLEAGQAHFGQCPL